MASQGRSTGTVTLTAAAPAVNAVVTLSSSNTDVARVSASSVSVLAGATTATFTIDASSVGASTNVTITASYEGVTRTATLTVTPPPLSARFTFTSVARGTDGCEISAADGDLDCTFDATSSTGPIDQYIWFVTVGSKELTHNTTQPIVKLDTDCTLLGGGTEDDDGRIEMRVELHLRGRDGTLSSKVNSTLKVWTNGRCGF